MLKNRKSMEKKKSKKRERDICLASQEQSSKCKPFIWFKLVRREFFYNQPLYMLPSYQSSLHSIPKRERERQNSLLFFN